MKKLISFLGTIAIVSGGMPTMIANTFLNNNNTNINITNQKVKAVRVPSNIPYKILVTAGDWGTSRLEKASFALNLGQMNPEQITDVAIAVHGNTYTEHHVPSWRSDQGHIWYEGGINHSGVFENYYYEKRDNAIVNKDGNQVQLTAATVKAYGNNNWSDTIEYDLARHYANSYVLYAWEKDNYNNLILNIFVALEVWASWTTTEGIAAVYVNGDINIYYN